MMVKRTHKKKRFLNIYPDIIDGSSIVVNIVGNPEGLRYLADVLNKLADVNQEKLDMPLGEREHIHLHQNNQLCEHSCEVEICRADARGTGELPDYH